MPATRVIAAEEGPADSEATGAHRHGCLSPAWRAGAGAGAGDTAVAGAVAWALSGLPSTAWTLVRGGDPMAAVRAAGALVLPAAARPAALVVAGAGVHTVVSFGWASVLALALPPRRTAAAGAVAGLAIAGLDLGVLGRRSPAIRALPVLPQVADHVAFGALVGAVLAHRRRRRRARP